MNKIITTLNVSILICVLALSYYIYSENQPTVFKHPSITIDRGMINVPEDSVINNKHAESVSITLINTGISNTGIMKKELQRIEGDTWKVITYCINGKKWLYIETNPYKWHYTPILRDTEPFGLVDCN